MLSIEIGAADELRFQREVLRIARMLKKTKNRIIEPVTSDRFNTILTIISINRRVTLLSWRGELITPNG